MRPRPRLPDEGRLEMVSGAGAIKAGPLLLLQSPLHLSHQLSLHCTVADEGVLVDHSYMSIFSAFLDPTGSLALTLLTK